jgi:hypothetical protein
MTKKAIMKELLEAHVVFSEKETTEELRALLKAVRIDQGYEPKKRGTPMTPFMKMKKAELKQAAREMGLPTQDSDTIGDMLRAIRLRIEGEPGEPQTVMTYGKHKGYSYDYVASTYPQYAEWVLDTMEKDNGECDIGFLRFGQWLLETKEARAEADRGRSSTWENPAATAKSKSRPSVPRASTPTHPKSWPAPPKASTMRKPPAEIPLNAEDSEPEIPMRGKPPQWDGEESTLQEYIEKTQIWKQMMDVEQGSESASSWLHATTAPPPRMPQQGTVRNRSGASTPCAEGRKMRQ